MENDDAENSKRETAKELCPSAANIHTDKQTGTSNDPNKKTRKHKKWGLRRHWEAASRRQQIKWVLEGISGIVAVMLVVSSFWSNLQSMWNFKAEHRPKVVVSRPPELLGTISCQVTEKAIFLHTGAMHLWVKNIRKGDAVGAFAFGPQFKLVPEKKIGDPFFDDLPSITDQTCAQKVDSKMKAFPVNGGQEVRVDMVQSAETVSLIKTNSVSVTLGGPLKEPETPAGETPSARVPIAKEAIFQLYAPVCVYYFDEDGKRYGSCRSYRLALSGTGNFDPYAFSCTGSPISGTFEETFFGYCEN